METLKDGELYSGLQGHQPSAYAVTEIPLVSLQRRVAATFRPENQHVT